MNTNKAIISTLSEEDCTQFISYLKQKNRRGDTKNIQLFKQLVKGTSEELDIKLYGKPSKNALHALSKRLTDSLIDFTANKSFAGETSEELEILKLLLASRIFFEHKKHKIAFKTLEKAEQKARNLDVYSILTEVYHTKIQYAHLSTTLSLSEISKEATINLQNFTKEQKLNLAYATITNEFLHTKEKSVLSIIEVAFSEYEIEINETLTYKSLFQLLKVVTKAATIKSDYYSLTPLLNEVASILEKKKALANKNLYYHIQLLNLLAYAYFRNKDFTTSKEFLSILKTQLEKGYRNQFIAKATVLEALLENYTGNAQQAISVLKNRKDQSLDGLLTLTMCHFQQTEFKEAYSVLRTLQHSDAWYEKKVGLLWILKKNLIEILLLIELDKLELVLSRLQSFKRTYHKRLQEIEENRVLNFITLITKYYENPKLVTHEAFINEVEASFDWKPYEEEDVFVMSFYAWLKAKMERRDMYEVTLELVKKK
ncbi:hypothetical protein [Patiriisocius hiemis]|uniref:Uncharacterized protein n=1 Tax=Patiriisocius hiemis TaxID=3075604 RepID=A0ABU2YCB4_9FLAO|nr:hypothetical protein [Constantimarinum sp. W242]MDT0555826.1 hypothetical protein [Constantimarinum sp. W242]